MAGCKPCPPERAWLGEVASVALVQTCQDARRAAHGGKDVDREIRYRVPGGRPGLGAPRIQSGHRAGG